MFAVFASESMPGTNGCPTEKPEETKSQLQSAGTLSLLLVEERICVLYTILPSVWQMTADMESGTPVGVRFSYVEFFDPGIAKQHFMALTL